MLLTWSFSFAAYIVSEKLLPVLEQHYNTKILAQFMQTNPKRQPV